MRIAAQTSAFLRWIPREINKPGKIHWLSY